MGNRKDRRPITKGKYRRQRAYLADHLFALSTGRSPRPTDLLRRKQWEHMMVLPTDVLLRTTDYMGTMLDDMLTQTYAWLRAMPENSTTAPFVFDAALDTHDEFCAAPFVAAHGWYRQATAALRNALEVMTHASRYAIRNDLIQA